MNTAKNPKIIPSNVVVEPKLDCSGSGSPITEYPSMLASADNVFSARANKNKLRIMTMV